MKDMKINDGDILIINGHIKLIEKREKLEQQILKIIVTRINFYLHPQYGSEVMNIMGRSFAVLEPQLKASIRQALDYFIQLQSTGIAFDLYDLEEILYRVNYINIKQISGDARGATVNLGIVDGTVKNFEINQNFVS